ncbi:hypothetical protein [Rhodohalobacter sp. 614A]|uniref:hypothetical protein n=1 Tax=Rhodohalobacter sp. 614A TaxID=2908649 RepID=UPI001F33996F|nr:hypothetical protein [Rhodohalobacter sp. 614A]
MKTNNSTKLRIQILLSILIIVLGIALMLIKIVTDSEPGAIPLLLIVLGTAWYFVTRNQMRTEPA